MKLTKNEVKLLKEKLTTLSKEDFRYLSIAIFKVSGERKRDILLADGTFTYPFHKMIADKAMELWIYTYNLIIIIENTLKYIDNKTK